MNPHPIQTLSRLLTRYGSEMTEDIRRVESFLRDIHPDCPRAVAVLVEALSCGVVTRLRLCLAQHDGVSLRPRDRDTLVRHMTESSGVSGRFALWAVDGWLSVLGVQESTEESTPTSHRTQGSLVRDRPGTLESVLGRHLPSAGTPPSVPTEA